MNDIESCHALFLAVIGRAIKDHQYLQRVLKKRALTQNEFTRLREVLAPGAPEDFFRSRWFEEICAMIDVDPDVVRQRLPASRHELPFASGWRVA